MGAIPVTAGGAGVLSQLNKTNDRMKRWVEFSINLIIS
jgi:hypothetical protein